MASASARRAPESRTSAKLLNAGPKTRRTSPTMLRKRMAPKIEDVETADEDNAVDPVIAEVGAPDDDRSSTLSEPDEDNMGPEETNGLEIHTDEPESQPAHASLEADSEAETERLGQTPQALRKRNDIVGATPSKLSQTATADDDLSEPPSPLPVGAGAASSTSTIATAGQKRKRSDTGDSSLSSADSDLGESPRKRSHEMTADDQLRREEAVEDAEMVDDAIERAEDTPMLDDVRDTPPVTLKGPKGRRGRGKGKKLKEQVDEADTEHVEEEADPAEEPSEEDPLKTEEQRKAKKEASGIYDSVAKAFRFFQDKLLNEKVEILTAELELLTQAECVHPEYLRQVACVETRFQKQVQESHAFFNYKLRSVRDRTLGERSQLHSQYFQQVRSMREDLLYKLGEEWYAIQKERRQSHNPETDDAFIYKFDPKRSSQVKQQAKYNLEVSILSGIARHVGFPAAPDIQGVDAEQGEEDMKKMRISKRQALPAAQPRTVYLTGHMQNSGQFTQSDRQAHEQYLEQNAWARPQAPILTHGTPGISHTPDWADSSASKHLRQSANQVARNSSPFGTPLPQKSLHHLEQPPSSGAGTVDVNSDGLGSSEMPIPSSVVAAPPTVDRMLYQQGGSSNQTSPLAFPKVRANGTFNDPPGFRNISGVSGTSTIDAPADQAAATEGATSNKSSLLPPSLPMDGSSAPQAFPTSQIHLHLGDDKDVYASAGFRPQTGAFGTPAPLHASPTKGAGA